jgi:membrane protease YdiL (CAAX protease family)
VASGALASVPFGRGDNASLAVVVALAMVVPGLAEELVFRGVVQPALEEEGLATTAAREGVGGIRRRRLVAFAAASVISLVAAPSPWSVAAILEQILPGASRWITGRLAAALITRLLLVAALVWFGR